MAGHVSPRTAVAGVAVLFGAGGLVGVPLAADAGRHQPLPTPPGYVDEAGPRPFYLPPITLRPGRGQGPGGAPNPADAQDRAVAASAPPAEMPALHPGSWSVEANLNRVAHLLELPTFRAGADPVLACRGSGNLPSNGPGTPGQRSVCFRYDHVLRSSVEVPLPDDWFCMDAVPDAQGRLKTAGGTGAYPEANTEVAKTWGGTRSSYRYRWDTGTIDKLGDMAVARWYPSLFNDVDGDTYVAGGQHNGVQQASWEVMRQGTTTWQPVSGLSLKMRSYSDMQLIGQETFAFTGSSGSAMGATTPFVIDMRTKTRTKTPGLRDTTSRRAAAALLTYPAQSEKVMVLGGFTADGTAATEKVDQIVYSRFPGTVPSFSPRAPLPRPMGFVNVVNLPNGQLFATGGSRVWRSGDVLWAGFYDAASNRWTVVTPPTVGRDYHTTVRVNLDGTVSVFGGNPTANVFHSEVETYRPWYMDQPRPSVDVRGLAVGGQPELRAGTTYRLPVTVPDGATIGDVTLDRQRALTHTASDPSQAMFQLRPTVGADGTVSVTVPTHETLTSGMYKLSVVTTDGVPSPSVWVHVTR